METNPTTTPQKLLAQPQILAQKQPLAQQTPPSTFPMTPQMIQTMPNATDIPKFRGFPQPADPPLPLGNPEMDVLHWLNLLEIYFRSANITQNDHKKLILLYNTSPRYGDARAFVTKFTTTEYRHFTYDDVKRDLILAYAPKSSTNLQAAAVQLFLNPYSPFDQILGQQFSSVAMTTK